MGNAYNARLSALREEIARRKLDGFVLPLTDEHMSEYGGAYAQRLRWLTGFRGSAGTAVILPEKAAIFVDGRYTTQVRLQVDAQYWTFESVPQTNPAAWLGVHAGKGMRVGYDPWLHTKTWVTTARSALADADAELAAVDSNPIDVLWTDRPAPSDATVSVHPEKIAGKSSAEKRRDIAAWLAARKADATVLCALDSIAWTFNIRGSDLEHTPVALAYAIVCADGTADLFIAPEKLTDEVVAHLGRDVRLHPRRAFIDHLSGLGSRRIAADPDRTVVAIVNALEGAGASVLETRDPTVLPKAIKNAAEMAGHKAAQARDGVALCRFLHWLSVEGPRGSLTELSAAARLRDLRAENGSLRDLSFGTISAFGPSSSIIHYRPDAQSDRTISAGSLYLVDSGGQYLDGTTDVTRTVAIGTPTAEMRDRFTRVLKGHIALASAVFPAGTRGFQLDALARQYLWAAGLDYAHGTGHGVGAYLCVHEGPQLIHRIARADEPLVPDMILSDEPGYYKTDEYGIRIENLLRVCERRVAGAERPMLGFEVLSFAPLDRALIELSMLTTAERAWLDDYHTEVARTIGPQMEGAAKSWLQEVTRPLA